MEKPWIFVLCKVYGNPDSKNSRFGIWLRLEVLIILYDSGNARPTINATTNYTCVSHIEIKRQLWQDSFSLSSLVLYW